MSTNGSRFTSAAHSCWTKDPPIFITLERMNPDEGIYNEHFEAKLCVNCATSVGIHLIADARAAMRPAVVHDSKRMLCSFCGKSRKGVEKLLAGPDTFICNECVGLCNEIIEEDREPNPSLVTRPLRTSDPVLD